ncbi:MAG: hypothetical protein LUQ13_04555, partial [Methanomicrobiales archaeon]|nr:hypothetical protein [Methanomicrobiales archaeon]
EAPPAVAAIPVPLPPDAQQYLHRTGEESMDISPDTYIVSITNAPFPDTSVDVQLAVPAQWANSTENRTVGILMWQDDADPVALGTRFVGTDLQGNWVYEATAPTLNATFGAVLVPKTPSAQPGFWEQLSPYGNYLALAMMVIAVGGMVGWIWRHRKRAVRFVLSEEEELQSVRNALKGLR